MPNVFMQTTVPCPLASREDPPRLGNLVALLRRPGHRIAGAGAGSGAATGERQVAVVPKLIIRV